MENRGFYYYFIQYMYLRIIDSKINVLEMGIPLCKIQGFPNLSPCYVTNWEFPLENGCYNR